MVGCCEFSAISAFVDVGARGATGASEHSAACHGFCAEAGDAPPNVPT